MRPTARSLLLDLLSTVSRGSVPVRALVRSGELFGIEANAIRVALARLRAAGLVASDQRGRYRLGRGAGAVRGQVGAWRARQPRTRRWDGGWLAVWTGNLSRGDRGALRRRLRALAFLGFRALEPGLEVRPDNLAESIEETRERLGALGLDAEAMVCRIESLDPGREARAHGLWDVDALRRAYRESARELTESAAALAGQPRERAMAESFLLGGAALRQLAYDPLLPEQLGSHEERDRLVEEMRRYDRLGREAWAGMLEVDGEHTPADLRAFEAVGALEANRGA